MPGMIEVFKPSIDDYKATCKLMPGVRAALSHVETEEGFGTHYIFGCDENNSFTTVHEFKGFLELGEFGDSADVDTAKMEDPKILTDGQHCVIQARSDMDSPVKLVRISHVSDPNVSNPALNESNVLES